MLVDSWLIAIAIYVWTVLFWTGLGIAIMTVIGGFVSRMRRPRRNSWLD